MSTALIFFGVFISYVYIFIPTRLKQKIRNNANIPMIELDPDDPRIPDPVRRSFESNEAVLHELRYTRAATLAYSMPSANYNAFSSIFHDTTTGDYAIAAQMISNGSLEGRKHFLEFTTDLEGHSSEICTSNISIPPLLPSSNVGDTWIFPGLSDINLLHRIHAEHCVASKHQPKPPATPILDYAATISRRELEYRHDYVSNGYYYLDQDANEFRMTWKGCYVAVWGQSFPVKPIRRWLMRRKANKILRSLGLPTNYPTESPALEAAKHDNDPTILVDPEPNHDTQPERAVTPELD